jgi:hypothetical protein
MLALPLTLAAGSAHAVPGQMSWTDTGQRSGGPITFTADAPLCPSGTVRDVGGITGIKMEHTCADGSGTFEFAVIGAGIFHFTPAGTGRYATLRGAGSCSVTQNQDGSFTRSCHALADFDDIAPTVRITNLDILLSNRFSRIGATFTTSDNVEGNAVSYRLSVTALGRALGHVTGSTPGGSVTTSLRMKLPRRAKRFVISLKVSDPLHNARTVTRSVKIRRR